MTTTAPGYGQVDRDYAMRMATCPPEEDGPVWMVNLMHYRGEAVYADGKSGISGREADERYAPLDILSDLGAEVAFMGEVEQQILGDAPRWDQVAVVRYPTRRSFIEMQARPDFQERHVHKEAGMAQTIVAGCLPLGPPRDLSSAQATDSTDATEPAWGSSCPSRSRSSVVFPAPLGPMSPRRSPRLTVIVKSRTIGRSS